MSQNSLEFLPRLVSIHRYDSGWMGDKWMVMDLLTGYYMIDSDLEEAISKIVVKREMWQKDIKKTKGDSLWERLKKGWYAATSK